MLASTKPGSSILSYCSGLRQPWICLVSLYAADVPGDSVAMHTQFMLKALERREVLLLKAALQQQKRNLQFLLLVRSLQASDTPRLLTGTSEFHRRCAQPGFGLPSRQALTSWPPGASWYWSIWTNSRFPRIYSSCVSHLSNNQAFPLIPLLLPSTD